MYIVGKDRLNASMFAGFLIHYEPQDKSELIRKATVEEWEAEETFNGVPFGLCNREWVAMLAKMQPGDELWSWASDQESWNKLAGRAGMALVRDGEVIDTFLTDVS